MIYKYDAVFFDFDGTIADTGEGIFYSVKYAIEKMGFPPLTDDRLRTFIGPPVFESFKRELAMNDEQAAQAVEKYRERYSESGIFKLRVYDGMENLIKELKNSGIKVAIASSKPEKFVMRLIDYLNISSLIDFIAAPESDKAPEGKTVLVERAVNHFGVKKSRALMVGDRYFDIDGANGAGVESIGVTFGYGSREELEKAGSTYLADNTEEIRKIIFS
ncbi:MAG: HAD hydrolase-like protein [Acutalibacteraceae bacterium]|nr:HAD hydrolase-like protein [Acutalibacteraceae bacterium]